MIHNENSRVKIPALVHLTRLGYKYIKQKDCSGAYCPKTNIFKGILRDNINRLNGTALTEADVDSLVEELAIKLNTDDLGRAFYKILLSGFNGLRLIDLEDESRNSYHVVTELTYQNGEDEFRPDITLLVNGLPLAFIEVKKPNNRDGIIAEHTRMNKRFAKKVFRRFANITQIMVFSNNMEYDDNDVEPIEGAFYASSSYEKLFFNRFREEDPTIHSSVRPVDSNIEETILMDNNLVTIKGTEEYALNIDEHTPTNRILTSLFTHSRFNMFLKYGFAYVERTDKNGIKTLQKHIMRYPQFFATLAIEKKQPHPQVGLRFMIRMKMTRIQTVTVIITTITTMMKTMTNTSITIMTMMRTVLTTLIATTNTAIAVTTTTIMRTARKSTASVHLFTTAFVLSIRTSSSSLLRTGQRA